MIYIDNEYKLPTHSITYSRTDKTVTQNVGIEGIEWWKDFEKQWKDMKIISINELQYSEEQLERLERINKLGLKDGFKDFVSAYVSDSSFPDGYTHPLVPVQLEVEKESTQLATFEMMNSMYEMNETLQEAIFELMNGGVE